MMTTKVLEKSAKQKKTNYFKHPLDLIFERSKKHELKKDDGGKSKTSAGAARLAPRRRPDSASAAPALATAATALAASQMVSAASAPAALSDAMEPVDADTASSAAPPGPAATSCAE